MSKAWGCERLGSTVHDLTVHRATPEDILRRHEIHKSKNKALVHLELQEKALKRKCKKQKQLDPDSLEKRKLALMRELDFICVYVRYLQ
ncbi:Coiled-coil domain-containing protein 52 [Anas platyrhynchos]|uniref:Spindle and centriole-associated protein 1 n=1 Tax=Anas platyrhynchos TaxID=8839 RepID=R0JQH3_ANAPL|nr:Coiled-coil domain-containing protein 52 [Anas platyrhynchos]